MSRSKPTKDNATLHQRRLAKDLTFSKAILIASVVLLLVVVIADVLYIAFVPRRGGHLILPSLVFTAPLTSIFFALLTLWNWRTLRDRVTTRPNDHSDNESLR